MTDRYIPPSCQCGMCGHDGDKFMWDQAAWFANHKDRIVAARVWIKWLNTRSRIYMTELRRRIEILKGNQTVGM